MRENHAPLLFGIPYHPWCNLCTRLHSNARLNASTIPRAVSRAFAHQFFHIFLRRLRLFAATEFFRKPTQAVASQKDLCAHFVTFHAFNHPNSTSTSP